MARAGLAHSPRELIGHHLDVLGPRSVDAALLDRVLPLAVERERAVARVLLIAEHN